MPKEHKLIKNPFAEDVYQTLEAVWDDFQKDMEQIRAYLAELAKKG
ncbi:MAG: hypothetical protein WC551_06935 [Patescibacteria group bacterium]